MSLTPKASLVVFALTLATAGPVYAEGPAFSAYSCAVKNAYDLSNGSLATSKLAPSYKKATFQVQRETGKMSGTYGVSSEGWIGRNEVLDLGSHEQSYKAIYISPPHVHLKTLVIEEYAEGPSKSFMYTEDSTVLTGNCVHVR